MNKKQILDAVEEAVLFNIQTNIIRLEDLNKSRLTFINDNLLKIVKDSRTDVYINVKDIRVLEVKKWVCK